MIPEDEVERIRESADIVGIIGEYVRLRRQGASYRGPCPFHQGTKPNFSVNPKTGFYKCFVCQEAGTVFTFLQKHLGMSFPDSIRLAAEKSGLTVREVQTQQREGPDPREPVWELNATAAQFFVDTLWKDERGAAARAYLESRGITREVADRFGLGYAPREIGLLRGHLNTLGFDDERLVAGGLLVVREEGSEPRPRFRDRLMFPIYDAQGHTVGFGGRLLGEGDVKYLNSSESDVFHKGRLLYGLNWAKSGIRKEERALLVEGYFDAVRIMAAGIESVVAPLGTALTDEQAALVARYTKNVFLLYDSDQAGLKATFRAGDVLLRHGVAVRVVTFPPGEDPDTFVATHGRAALEAQIASAVDVFDRKVQLLERAGWFADLHRRRRAIDRLLPTVRAASDPLTRDIYLTRAAEASGVDKALLQREAEATPAYDGRRPAQGAPRSGDGDGRQVQPRFGDRRGGERREMAPRTARQAAGVAAERELVRAMLASRPLAERIAERLGPEGFRDPLYGEIFATLLRIGPEAMVDEIAASLSEPAARALDALLAEPDAIVHLERTVEGALTQLRVRELHDRSREIERLMTLASDGEKDRLLREKQAIRDEVSSLGGAVWKVRRTTP